MLKTKEAINKKKKQIFRASIKNVITNLEDFIDFLDSFVNDMGVKKQDAQQFKRKTKRKPMTSKKPTQEEKKWAIEYYRDCGLVKDDDEELLVNQMLANSNTIDLDYEEKQSWLDLQDNLESKIQYMSKDKTKELNQSNYISED